jgi:glycosyltransferase involved in cell wall biosynthesis
VALVSTGLGRVRRGFESFMESLFTQLRRNRPDWDVVLFQGGGRSGDHRRVVRNLHRSDAPARWFGAHRASLLEKRSFALALYPWIRFGGFDVVHYNELTMGSALMHLRRRLGGQFRLLYCNGAPSPPVHYHRRCDLAQMLHGPMYDEATAFGISEERLALLPYGVDTERFAPDRRADREAVRSSLGIPSDVPVVLSVAAIKREHKRFDYMIEEVARAGTEFWLVVAGQKTSDTAFLSKLAQEKLGQRWRFVSWPHERMPELYGAADIFALASLTEGLGLVVLEAMASALPVVTHDAPVFRWVAGTSGLRLIDMSRPGMLADVLVETWTAMRQPEVDSNRREVMTRFSWQVLLPQYLDLYHKAAGSSLLRECA